MRGSAPSFTHPRGTKPKIPYVPLDPFAQVYDPDRDFRNKVVSDELWKKAKKGNKDMSCSRYAPEWMKDGLGIPFIPPNMTDKERDEFYRRRPEPKASSSSSAASTNSATPSPQQQTTPSSNSSSSSKAEIEPSLTVAECKARLGGKGLNTSKWAINPATPKPVPKISARPNRAIAIRSPHEGNPASEDQSSPLASQLTIPSNIPISPLAKHDLYPRSSHIVPGNQEKSGTDVVGEVQKTTEQIIDSEHSSYESYLLLRKNTAPHLWHTVPGFQESPPRTDIIAEVKKMDKHTTVPQHNLDASGLNGSLALSSDRSVNQASENSSYESYLLLRKNIAPHLWHTVPGFKTSPPKTDIVREITKTIEQTTILQHHPNASEQKENLTVSPEGSISQATEHTSYLLLKKNTAPHLWHTLPGYSSHQAKATTDINHPIQNKSEDKVAHQHCPGNSRQNQPLARSAEVSSSEASGHYSTYLLLKKTTAPHFWHTLPGYPGNQAITASDIRHRIEIKSEGKLGLQHRPEISEQKQELTFPAEDSSSQASDITSTTSFKKHLSSHPSEATVPNQSKINSERSVVVTPPSDTSEMEPTINFEVGVSSQTTDNMPITRLQDNVVISEAKPDYVLSHMKQLHHSIRNTESVTADPPNFEAEKVTIISKLTHGETEKVRYTDRSTTTTTKSTHLEAEKVTSTKMTDDSGLVSNDDFMAAFLKMQTQKSQPRKVACPAKAATPPRKNPLSMNFILPDTNDSFHAAAKSRQQEIQRNSKAKIYTCQENQAAAVKPASDDNSMKFNAKSNEAHNPIAELMLAQLSAQRDLASPSNPLTKSALAAVSGLPTPPSQSNPEDTFDISDNGVTNQPDGDQPKEGVRAHQGFPATQELLDWDGTIVPPPCDWENDRTKFDTSSFVNDYVREWNAVVRSFGPKPRVDTSDPEFTSPTCGDIENGELLRCWEHNYITIPDEKFSEDNEKRLNQTSESVMAVAIRRKKTQETREKELKEAYQRRELEIAAQEPEPNAFAPKIDMYLRPATIRDQEQIARIYNHYVETTHITEDICPIEPETAAWMVYNTHEAGMPFIVAVRGNAPSMQDAQGRAGPSQNSVMPAHENIIGFTFAEEYSNGWNGSRAGRSRTTANLQIYVDHRYTRKGVGRNMLDRMMYSLNPITYSFENTCDWVDPNCSRIYNGGLGTWHQLTIQLSILKEKDPNYDGVMRFLASKFFFIEQSRLASIGRTSPYRETLPQWLDLVFFQTQATHGEVVAIDY